MTTLTSENVFHYLRKRKLINEAEVTKGNYVVIPVKTRNNIMKIRVVQGHSLFVKQLRHEPISDGLFKREIAAYKLFQQYPETFSITSSPPVLLNYNEEEHILVTELLEDAKSVHEYYMLSKNFDPALAREQALLLASFHRAAFSENDTKVFPKILPWVLQLNNHNANEFFANNKAPANIIALVKENPFMQNCLSGLANEWNYTHLVHGDVKWINFLIREDETGRTQKLIDWELADMGDPLWDVAGLLQSYIVTWLYGFDNNNPHLQSLPQQMEPYNLKHLQPSAQAFLEEYLNICAYPQQEHAAILLKVMRYTAARIIQTCTEGVSFHSKIEANNIRGIQLAHNIFKDPAYALKELLNIDI